MKRAHNSRKERALRAKGAHIVHRITGNTTGPQAQPEIYQAPAIGYNANKLVTIIGLLVILTAVVAIIWPAAPNAQEAATPQVVDNQSATSKLGASEQTFFREFGEKRMLASLLGADSTSIKELVNKTLAGICLAFDLRKKGGDVYYHVDNHVDSEACSRHFKLGDDGRIYYDLSGAANGCFRVSSREMVHDNNTYMAELRLVYVG